MAGRNSQCCNVERVRIGHLFDVGIGDFAMTFDRSRIFTVKPEDVDAVRPWLEPFLAEFAQKTCLVAPEDVIRQAKQADCQLWSYHDGERFRGVVATRIHRTTLGHMCSLWVCIGLDADELMEGVHHEIEGWARGLGCYALEIVGRAGWLKKLPGYTRKAVVLEKRLQDVH